MRYIIAIILAAVGIGLIVYYFQNRSELGEPAAVSSFEECVQAGHPVMESYPRQCRAGDQTFIENIGNELDKIDLIRVGSPRPNQTVSSPLTITGEARGGWYFEATFPVRIEDENGSVLGQHYAQAQGEWMTEEFVPFEGVLEFGEPQTPTGRLILEKSNPSGLSEHDEALIIPVKF